MREADVYRRAMRKRGTVLDRREIRRGGDLGGARIKREKTCVGLEGGKAEEKQKNTRLKKRGFSCQKKNTEDSRGELLENLLAGGKTVNLQKTLGIRMIISKELEGKIGDLGSQCQDGGVCVILDGPKKKEKSLQGKLLHEGEEGRGSWLRRGARREGLVLKKRYLSSIERGGVEGPESNHAPKWST